MFSCLNFLKHAQGKSTCVPNYVALYLQVTQLWVILIFLIVILFFFFLQRASILHSETHKDIF